METTAKSVLQIFVFALAIAAAAAVVGLSLDKMTTQPVAIVVWGGIACLLIGLLLSWTLQSFGLGEYLERAVIGFSLLVALSGGIYLAGAVHVFGDPQKAEAVVRTALSWCLAYYGCGFLVGFLFGFPRVLQGDNPPANGANTAAEVSGKRQSPGGAAAVGPAGYAQRVNTNLEQISDWLTKIIVGLGLVELRTMPDHLYRASDWMARSFSTAEAGAPSQAAASFSSAFIVFFAIAGFMAGYLVTRLFLAPAFLRADQPPPPRTVEGTYQGAMDQDALKTWLTKKGITESVPSFWSEPQYTSQRAEAIREIGDPNIDRIKSFWKPRGVVDPDHEKVLKTWLSENGIDESVVSFLSKPQYTSQRAKAIRDIPIPQTETAS